jgi:hypothetical protein
MVTDIGEVKCAVSWVTAFEILLESAGFSFRLLFGPEDGDDMFLRNVRPSTKYKTVLSILTAVRTWNPSRSDKLQCTLACKDIRIIQLHNIGLKYEFGVPINVTNMPFRSPTSIRSKLV